MPERSDWSGAVLGGDDPAVVTFVHENGQRRRVRVTSKEEQRLLSMGVDITRRPDRVVAWVRKAAVKLLPWFAALVAGALITGEVASRFADRQQELDLKSSIIGKISRGSVRAHVDDGTERAAYTETIRRYLREYFKKATPSSPYPQRDPWSVLECRPQRCSESGEWRAHFRWLGLWLLRLRGPLAKDILDGDAKNLG
jgi:hypothetical protein